MASYCNSYQFVINNDLGICKMPLM